MSSATGCYPGSFNPLTVVHLAVAEAAVAQCGLGRVDLVVSRVALGKEDVARPRLEDRVAVLEAAAAHRSWLGVAVTDHQLLADIADRYDVLVMGSDKWAQVLDPSFYGGSEAARDRALTRLPRLAVAPRADHHDVPAGAVVLDVPADLAAVSATGARDGRLDWMAPEARAFDERTGAWSDADRYDRWVAAGRPDGGVL